MPPTCRRGLWGAEGRSEFRDGAGGGGKEARWQGTWRGSGLLTCRECTPESRSCFLRAPLAELSQPVAKPKRSWWAVAFGGLATVALLAILILGLIRAIELIFGLFG